VQVEIVVADYANPDHCRDLVDLLDQYARDPMGGGAPLSDEVKASLPSELARRPSALSLLCYVNGAPAGLLNGFEGFSTFACKPLINIHDVVILKEFRGLRISQRLLARLEELARDRGCCKLTLEVLQGNEVAANAYRKFGFKGYELDPAMGQALFWQKLIQG